MNIWRFLPSSHRHHVNRNSRNIWVRLHRLEGGQGKLIDLGEIDIEINKMWHIEYLCKGKYPLTWSYMFMYFILYLYSYSLFNLRHFQISFRWNKNTQLVLLDKTLYLKRNEHIHVSKIQKQYTVQHIQSSLLKNMCKQSCSVRASSGGHFWFVLWFGRLNLHGHQITWGRTR